VIIKNQIINTRIVTTMFENGCLLLQIKANCQSDHLNQAGKSIKMMFS